MVGFFGTSAAYVHCHLQLRNGSVHSELIRPNHYRPRSVIRCCSTARGRTRDYYYQVLGVTVHSTPQEIKEAYRKLQKQHHPDIAGYKSHDYTLLLNEAYNVLMRNLSRHVDGKSRAGTGSGYTGDGYSSWNGPVRSQALFVDENKCIGCRECVHHAARTFSMDDVLGSAHVDIQFGDLEQQIQLAVESCPVNCIHWVESQELPVLEFLSRPQPKEGHGIFGGGWERPRNVFAAAKNFAKRLEREEQELEREQSSRSHGGHADCEAETEAQAEARHRAGEELRWKPLVDIWNGFRGWRKGGTDR
ncbi:chaperone protein dnaJ C76, chloroplastic isoform X1 [Setaria italica]|uniref:J domain-containing protein n=1 Tax=Setaria italica TaxID=4555 RepID=K3XYG8_SETIT|nr:chaperone protein dnaJ C76, chloroplastic isoform X1 [Setaria italica]